MAADQAIPQAEADMETAAIKSFLETFGMDIRVQRIYFLFNFHLAHTFFSVFFNSKNNLFSYIF